MSDHTESKVRQWATRRNGDPLTPRDVVELVLAVDDDGNARHQETIDLLAAQNARVVLLEEWRASCPAAFAAEHEERHARHMADCHAPRREDDLPGADYSDERRDATDHERTFLMWTLGSKLGAFVIAVLLAAVVTLVNVAVNYLWFGHP